MPWWCEKDCERFCLVDEFAGLSVCVCQTVEAISALSIGAFSFFPFLYHVMKVMSQRKCKEFGQRVTAGEKQEKRSGHSYLGRGKNGSVYLRRLR